MVAVQHLIIRDRAPGVRRHAAHRRHEARFHPTLHLVVGPVRADRRYEIIPLDLVGIGLRLREGPGTMAILVTEDSVSAPGSLHIVHSAGSKAAS